MASFVVLYTRPEDPEGFERHLRETHLPLVEQWPGVTEIRVTRMTGTPRGTEPPYHLLVEARFASDEELAAAMQADVVRASGKDAMEMCKRYGAEATMLLGEHF
jgi:uncharacterized protein (TIGR02118 family)